MTCTHEYVIKDGLSDTNSFKVEICSKCLSIKKVLPRGDAPQKPSVWDSKDLRITRMSVLKTASEFMVGEDIEAVLKLAERLENWVYRQKEGL